MLVEQHGIGMTMAHNGGHNAPLPQAWACLLGGSIPVAGIVNKVQGGMVHCPGMTLVDGVSHQPADQVKW